MCNASDLCAGSDSDGYGSDGCVSVLKSEVSQRERERERERKRKRNGCVHTCVTPECPIRRSDSS